MDTDILVAGAGCAGLSLAVHLQRTGRRDVRVLILDPRQHHARDRTWCFWPMFDHPFEPAVRHRWFRWKIVTGSGEVERGSPSLGYRYLPADAFYDLALERLSASQTVQVLRNVSVDAFRDDGDGVVAMTSQGEIRGRLAFDGRPLPRPDFVPAHQTFWLQHFVGLEVETERPVFDPEVATLMDFRVGEGTGDIRFTYVLPLSERRALVEDTFFGGAPRSEEEHADSIAEYLEERLGAGEWKALSRETGMIPMSTLPPPTAPSPRVANIGTRAGLARPSTGYAFLAIQRHSSRLAGHLERHGLRPPPVWRPYGRVTMFLDRVFLAYLERWPGTAPDLFLRMFSGIDPERMARFLFDGGTALDRAAVMSVLPAGPLTRQALRDLGPNLRDALRGSRER